MEAYNSAKKEMTMTSHRKFSEMLKMPNLARAMWENFF